MFVVALALGPLAAVRTSTDSSGWSGLFNFLVMCWLAEMVAAVAAALLIRLLKNVRKQKGSRTLRAELLVARLAFWGSLLLSLALPCAIAWVWLMAFAMLSS